MNLGCSLLFKVGVEVRSSRKDRSIRQLPHPAETQADPKQEQSYECQLRSVMEKTGFGQNEKLLSSLREPQSIGGKTTVIKASILIPAKDEALNIRTCLDAVLSQENQHGV